MNGFLANIETAFWQNTPTSFVGYPALEADGELKPNQFEDRDYRAVAAICRRGFVPPIKLSSV
jgi:hypothetical protein